ncbi:MAG: DUF423 domain-containing protein [Rhodospirillales bacterium]|nr:DUF423 domain-containing protein [Rhodospirillales bacterium]
MIQTWKAWVSLGALNGLIAVGAGAYAAHWLKARDPVLANAFAIGVDYQAWHALALLAVAWLAERAESAGRAGESPRALNSAPLSGRAPWLARLAGLAFVLGVALFSGTLYVFGASGSVWMSGAAPAGGALLMAGWVLLALSPIGARAQSRR